MVPAIILITLAILFAGWRIWRRLRYSLHMYQLHGYKFGEFGLWTIRRPLDFVIRKSHILAISLLIASVPAADVISSRVLVATLATGWLVAFHSSRRYRSNVEKKPLAWTNRSKRLLAVCVLLALTPVIWTASGVSGRSFVDGVRLILLGLLVADFLVPFAVLFAGVLLEPLEAAFRRGFKREARRKLAAYKGLTSIGITGSYGKTSVKFIINNILSLRYNTLATPGSYNTPMGLCRVINDMLRPEHQVLVAEMGARYRGDIRELCELVTPSIGVITNVGVAHLETMGSADNIEREKGELAAAVPPAGAVVLNADDDRVLRMEKRTEARVVTVSAEGRDADFVADEVRYGPSGSTFVVRTRQGKVQVFKTALLGRHNISNILMGVAVGVSMGLRLRQIAHAVASIQPVEHRLQLRKEGHITIIDDAFNSNPVGARNAVEILGQFRTGRRVIVTPGMIELGEREFDENKHFGEVIAQNVDFAILVGPGRTASIAEGLSESGFPEEQVRVFRTLFDAQDFLKQYLRSGDVVLYENDLPDQYDEAA